MRLFKRFAMILAVVFGSGLICHVQDVGHIQMESTPGVQIFMDGALMGITEQEATHI